jgi:cell wall assembly regulator SMI1
LATTEKLWSIVQQHMAYDGQHYKSLQAKESLTAELFTKYRASRLATDPATSDDVPFIEEDLRDIPLEVRNTVSFEDNQSLPTITFRYFLLTFIFIAPGAFLYQMVSLTPNQI